MHILEDIHRFYFSAHLMKWLARQNQMRCLLPAIEHEAELQQNSYSYSASVSCRSLCINSHLKRDTFDRLNRVAPIELHWLGEFICEFIYFLFLFYRKNSIEFLDSALINFSSSKAALPLAQHIQVTTLLGRMKKKRKHSRDNELTCIRSLLGIALR